MNERFAIPIPPAPEKLGVKVWAMNDEGETRAEYGYGWDANEAVADAIAFLIEETGDDTFAMNEWAAA